MKRQPFNPIVFLIFVVGFLSHSCAKLEIESPDFRMNNKVRLSIEEAERDFELSVNFAKSRANAPEQVANALSVGWLSPYWELSQASENSRLQSLDTPIESQYNFAVVYRETDSLYRAYPFYHGALVVKGKESLTTTSYLIFYIPDSTYIANIQADKYVPPYLNSSTKEDFSGSVVYATTSGFPVAFSTFKRGQCTDAMFLADTTLSLDYRCSRLAVFLEDLPPIIRDNITTRTNGEGDNTEPIIADGVDGTGYIDSVYVNANSLMSKVAWDSVIRLQYQNLIKGGNYNGNAPEDPTTDPSDTNSNQDTGGGGDVTWGPTYYDPQIKERIDSLQNDCIGAKLVDSLSKHNITFVANTSVNNASNTSISNIDNGVLTGTITINPNALDIVFVEELTHLVQIANNPDFATQKLNIEIEAKLVWCYYCVSNNVRLSRYRNALGRNHEKYDSDVIDTMLDTLDYIHVYQQEPDNSTLLIQIGYCIEVLADRLRTIPAYSDESVYPFDGTKCLIDTFVKLTEGC